MRSILFLLLSMAAIQTAAQIPADQKPPVETQSANSPAVASISPVLPVGLNFPATLAKSIDSKKSKPGDEVTAKVPVDIAFKGQMLIPRNSILMGHVAAATFKREGESGSALTIIFDHAVLKDGQSVQFNAIIRTIEGPAETNRFSATTPTPLAYDLGSGHMSGISQTANNGGTSHAGSGNSQREDVPGRKDLKLVDGTITATKDSVKLEGGSRLRLEVVEAPKN